MKQEKTATYDVLFVCDGNVGRSQMAEAFYNHFNPSKIAISAGVNDVANKYNGHPTQEIVDVMFEEGIDVSKKQIKLVSDDMISRSKHVVVLCDKDMCPNMLLSGDKKIVFIRIDDPYQMEIKGTRKIRDQIKQLVMKLKA